MSEPGPRRALAAAVGVPQVPAAGGADPVLVAQPSLADLRPLLLLGCGNMGSALLGRWLEAGLAPPNVTVVDPSPAQLPDGVLRVGGLDRLVRSAEARPAVIVLAVKPQVAPALLAALGPLVGPGTLVLSIMAGLDLATLRSLIGPVPIVRSMPNMPARIGRGVTALFADPATADPGLNERAGRLMRAAGDVVWLEREAQFDAVTAVSGSGPAYLFHFIEALEAAAVGLGLPPDLAQRLGRGAVTGAAALAACSEASAAELRQSVTSPGGTTEAALGVLAPRLAQLLQEAVGAAARRSAELAREGMAARPEGGA